MEARIAALLAEAETADAAEDARLGVDRCNEDLPGELAGSVALCGTGQAESG